MTKYQNHRITNISSISKKHQHPFHLESMRHVLFGLSTPTSQRLQHIRPNRSLKREELLSNYDRQMGLITYTTEPRFRLPSRPSSAAPILEKNHCTQNRPTSVSNNNIIRSRPVSANNRSSSTRIVL